MHSFSVWNIFIGLQLKLTNFHIFLLVPHVYCEDGLTPLECALKGGSIFSSEVRMPHFKVISYNEMMWMNVYSLTFTNDEI